MNYVYHLLTSKEKTSLVLKLLFAACIDRFSISTGPDCIDITSRCFMSLIKFSITLSHLNTV